MTEFRMPSLGADMAAGTLREWRKQPGETVRRGDIIAEVETQKGIIEVEIFIDGVIGKLLLKEDQQVPVGTPTAEILTAAEWEQLKSAEPIVAPVQSARKRISPLARKLAEEAGISLEGISGSGEQGAVIAKDIVLKPATVAAKESAPSVRAAVAATMERSNKEIPHYYLQKVIDLNVLTGFLSERNRHVAPEHRILPAAAWVKATAMALKECPDLNGWWKAGQLQRADGIHIGFAISLRGGGLVNPAITDADSLSLEETMVRLSGLIDRARNGKLRSTEFSAGTITVSSIGTDGADTLFGRIHPPQVALVGIGPIREHVLAVDGMVAIRPAAMVTLAADHRATDGTYGSRFLRLLAEQLQHPGKW